MVKHFHPHNFLSSRIIEVEGPISSLLGTIIPKANAFFIVAAFDFERQQLPVSTGFDSNPANILLGFDVGSE